ncbi:hydrolase [Thaumasiovibrio subtropicus]|uniref:hydrolase n=1 Tax=Thaumasiovibrio subtropicus TaxID=1891207 RepID=UPI000B34FBC0|nr:hydrolase [Thaumasiovibrio subtropicus]
MLEIPSRFLDVDYVSARIPGVENEEDLTLGANCQVFAYSLLRHFGLMPPCLRSSELWADEVDTYVVTELKPLDIMMYNHSPVAYGAHVGVYWGNGQVLHLSLDNGKPKLESHEALLTQRKYCHFIGAKRVKATLSNGA